MPINKIGHTFYVFSWWFSWYNLLRSFHYPYIHTICIGPNTLFGWHNHRWPCDDWRHGPWYTRTCTHTHTQARNIFAPNRRQIIERHDEEFTNRPLWPNFTANAVKVQVFSFKDLFKNVCPTSPILLRLHYVGGVAVGNAQIVPNH